MPILTTAILLDKLLSKGLDVGLDKLATARPEQLDKAVAKLRDQEAAVRQARLRDVVAEAARLAQTVYAGQVDEGGEPLTKMLEHPPFLARATELLLLGDRPEVARLREEFLPLVGEAGWAAGQRPLLRFLQELDKLLGQDDTWGPVLSAFRVEAGLSSIDRNTLALQESLAEIVKQVAALPAATAKALAKELHPLDLADLEKHYLRAVYAECSDVPLASSELPPDSPQVRRPRLQKIYVDLFTTAVPDLDQVFARLGIDAAGRPRAEAVLRKAIGSAGSGPEAGRGRRGPGEELSVASLRLLVAERGRGERDTVPALEKSLGVAAGSLSPALGDLSVLEAIGQHRQVVILGDPGSGKSTLTRRLAAAFAAVACDELPEEERDWRTALQGTFERWLLPVRVVLSRWATHLPAKRAGVADDLIAECRRILKTSGDLEGPRQAEQMLARLTGTPPSMLLLLDGLDEVADPGQRKCLLAAVRHFHDAYPQVPLIVTCRQRPYRDGKFYRLPLPDFDLAPLGRPAVDDFLQRWHDELVWAGLYQPQAAANALRRLREAIDDRQRGELREMSGTPLLLTMMARVNYEKGLPDSRAALYEAYVRQLLWEWERWKLDDRGEPTGLEILLQGAGVSQPSLERALNRLAYGVHGADGARSVVDIPQGRIRDVLEEIHAGDPAARAAWAVQVLQLMDDRSGLIYAVEQGRLYRFSHRTFQEYLAARWLASGEFVAKFKEKIDLEQWREAVFLALGYQVSVLGAYDSALAVIDELLPAEPVREADWARVLLLGEAYARLLGPQRAREAEQEKLRARVMADVPARLVAAMHDRSLSPRQRLDAGLLLDRLQVDPPGLDEFVAAPGWGFAIGRYPVTNRQFRRFVDAGGYAAENEARWWGKEGLKHKQNEMWTEPRYWDDARFNHPAHPVVGVSWYEANAYCAWLTEHLTAQSLITGEQAVRLPTQAAWEQAARSSDGRAYPWGSEFAADCANTEESGLGQTTPVWMYPDGRTPEGVWDMAGNVWEWTAGVDTDGISLLTGGAWFWPADRVNSAARVRRRPWFRGYYVGFRVVVVPVSRDGLVLAADF